MDNQQKIEEEEEPEDVQEEQQEDIEVVKDTESNNEQPSSSPPPQPRKTLDDNEGWITPDNIRQVKLKMQGEYETLENTKVGCITTDFGMQVPSCERMH